jgi:hypothetical protein
MLDSVAGLVAADLLRGVSIPAGHVVCIASPLPGDTLGFLAQRMVESLREAGTEVRLVPSRATAGLRMEFEDPAAMPYSDSTDLHLNLQVSNAGVNYVRAIRKFPLGVGGYERLASMRVGASLVDRSTREVLCRRSMSCDEATFPMRRAGPAG